MKNTFSTIWIYGLLTWMTAGYCAIIELGGLGLDSSTIKLFGEGEDFPWPYQIFSYTETSIIWQVLAFVSLFGNMFWGIMRERKSNHPEPHLFPAVCHLSWIGAWTIWHAIGWVVPFLIMEPLQ